MINGEIPVPTGQWENTYDKTMVNDENLSPFSGKRGTNVTTTSVRECVTYKRNLTLHNRKWQTITQIAKLQKRIHVYEENRTNVNVAIASDIYRTTVRQIQNEQGNVLHLTQQIDAMQKLIDISRHTLIQIYTNLYSNWDEVNDLTRSLSDTLRTNRIYTPNIVQSFLRRNLYTLDFFRCVEIMRSTNTLIMKLIEEVYDKSFDQILPDSTRTVNSVTIPLDEGYNEQTCTEVNEAEGNRSRDILLLSIRHLNNTIRVTR